MLKLDACHEFYNETLQMGISKMIYYGVYGGYLRDAAHGISYYRDLIEAFEIAEEYEKCGVLLDMLTSYELTLSKQYHISY